MSDDIELADERLDLGDVLNTVLDKGLALRGGVTLAVAGVDLVRLELGLLLAAVETVLRREENAPVLASVLGPPLLSPRRGSDVPAAADFEAGDTLPAARIKEVAPALPERINADANAAENGLARLVLTLIELLRKVLEHQAVRRMDGGTLTDEEVERLGVAMLRLHERMKEMKETFGLTDDDLQIDLGPLGRLR